MPPNADVKIRRFRQGDEAGLYGIFHSAIHRVAARDYTPEQINAWAPDTIDLERWSAKVQGIKPFIAQIANEIVGYADLQDSGYIDHLFVSGLHPRQGIGQKLMEHIHAQAFALKLEGLFADVSRTAQPFFLRFGFAIVEQRLPVVRGVPIPNALMRKSLRSQPVG